MNNNDLFENPKGNFVGGVVEKSISPEALVIDGKITFEPLLGGVRVTARDVSNQTLWGFVASKRMIEQHHCPVGIHVTFKELINKELKKHKHAHNKSSSQKEPAIQEIKDLQTKLNKYLDKLQVQNPTEATYKRAQAIYKAVHDANILIDLDMDNFSLQN